MRQSLKTIARKSPSAKVVATERIAKAKVQTITLTRGVRISSSPNARAKFSKPTSIFQPG